MFQLDPPWPGIARMFTRPGLFLRTDPSNRFAYAGNLGNDHVLQYRFDANTGPRHLTFAVDAATGGLKFLDNYPVEEKPPRNIAFSPNGQWLLVTGEKSDKVGTYAVSGTGALKRVGEAASGKGALWIEVLRTAAQ